MTGNANLCYSIRVAPDKVKQIKNTEHWRINSNATLKILLRKRTFRFMVQKEPFDEYSENKSFINSNVNCNGYLASSKLVLRSKHLNMRVWSWLRMNAGGVLNTCKSNGLYMKPSDCKVSGGRVSNAWITCLILGDNSWKRLLIPHKRTVPHGTVWKTPVV